MFQFLKKAYNVVDLTQMVKAERDKTQKLIQERFDGANRVHPTQTSHMDGWSNLITQVGTSGDKRTQNRIFWENRSPEFFEQLYSGDELASRIVNVVPDEAMRKGWEWTGVEKNISTAVQKRAADLDLRGAIERTWKWGRAYGGACLYIVTDTTDPASPLRQGERVIGLRDLSRYDLRILTTDIETDFGNPNWGHPRVYYLMVQMGSQFKGYPIHWTRMVRFDGYLVPRRTFIRNNYWHDSILNRLYNAIRNYQSSNDAVATMLQDFNVDVYKMSQLANLMGAGQEAVVKARIEMLQYSKSVIRALILDSDDEDYENIQRSIEGVAELLTKQANRLVAATDIPHTKLLGESPDGSSATGNSTTQQWFDHVQSEQENYLRPRLERLKDAIFYDIPDLGFKFKSLYQLTELEQAELRNKTAQTDQIYISQGVLDPTEIAQSRFGGEEYSTETKLDEDARNAGLIGPGSGQQQQGQMFSPEDPVDPNDPSGDLPPEGTPDPQGLGQASPVPQQPIVSPPYASNAWNPAAEADEQETEEAALPESVQEFTPNPKGVETQNPGTQFDFRNEAANLPEKKKALISQTMSEPMRDPATDPKLKPGGRPNHPRVTIPSRGNQMVANPRTDESPPGFQVQPKPMQQVSVVGLLAGHKMLLGKRRDSGKWVLPGGGNAGDESPEQCASRELQEETGIEIAPEKMTRVGMSMGQDEQNLYQVETFIVNTDVEPATGKFDPDQEVDHWEWVDISKGLPPEIAQHLEHANIEPFKQLGVL